MDATNGAGSYVPNNPQFGLQLECNWSCSGSIQACNQQGPCSGQSSGCQEDLSCWTTTSTTADDMMGSFTLPLDLEPLPSLFPFSPVSCTTATTNVLNNNNSISNNNNFKNEPFQNTLPTAGLLMRDAKAPSSDVADVLLSLKHAVVHPGQGSNDKYDFLLQQQQQHQQQQQQHQQQQQQHLYHPQVLLSPNGYASLPDQQQQQQSFVQQPSMFPSMSVNVSMNMTMHGYHPHHHHHHHHHANVNYPTAEIQCPQVQWNAPHQLGSPVNYQQGLLSPGYGGATYSFTADFRAPQPDQTQLLTPAGQSYKTSVPLVPRKKSHGGSGTSSSNGSGSIVDDDLQKPNVCRICGKSYARPSTLKTHLRTHSGEKPYRCIDCNKSFSQAANLTAHVRTHSGEKPFRCPVCDRRFSQSSSVTTHMRTHSGERPYRCRLCRKAFSDSSTLTKHLRIHSGEKPYECKLCLLRFSQSGNLNRHMRVHGGGTAAGLMPP